MFLKTKNKNNSFIAVTSDGEFAGLYYTIKNENIIYIHFLAVYKEKRGQGIGTKIWERIKKENPDYTVVLMIEDTELENIKNKEERLNRLKFYQSNGYIKLGIKINEAGVEYELLGTDNNVTKADFLSLMKNYCGKFYYKYLYRKTHI